MTLPTTWWRWALLAFGLLWLLVVIVGAWLETKERGDGDDLGE